MINTTADERRLFLNRIGLRDEQCNDANFYRAQRARRGVSGAAPGPGAFIRERRVSGTVRSVETGDRQVKLFSQTH